MKHASTGKPSPARHPAELVCKDESKTTRKSNRASRLNELVFWLCIDLAVVALVLAALLYRPSGYNRPKLTPLAPGEKKRVHPYLTHELWPALYNNAQLGRPFDLIVSDKALSEALASDRWHQPTGDFALSGPNVVFSSPKVIFTQGRVAVIATAEIEGVDLIITVVVEPAFDEQGLLKLRMEQVKIGAAPVTPLVRLIGGHMYRQQLETVPVDTTDIRTQIAASLLTNEPFDPVFKIDDRRVRLTDVTITPGALTAHLVPIK